MKVCIYNAQRTLPLSKTAVEGWVKKMLKEEVKEPFHEVIIHFVSKRKISSLHAAHFNDPAPTDCISFPLDSPSRERYSVLGEIFVCPKTAIEYSQKYKKDPYTETALYIIHGLLHLLGYDDKTVSEQKRMRRAEKRCLKLYYGNRD